MAGGRPWADLTVDQFTDLRLAAVKSAEIEQLQQWITNRAIDLRNRVGSGELTT